jgi:hypothetical protein
MSERSGGGPVSLSDLRETGITSHMTNDPFTQSVLELFEGISREPVNTLVIITLFVFVVALLGWRRGEMESKREYQKFVDTMARFDELRKKKGD